MKNPHSYIIAEAGVNHNGELERAYQLVDVAFNAGTDSVKFQTFKAKKLVTQAAKMADYQTRNTQKTESQFDMLKKLELSPEEQKQVAEYCHKKGIEFLSSPFDNESARWLLDDLGLKTIKVGSGEITNGPMLLEIAQRRPKTIISTGMANLADIEQALAVLSFGYLMPEKTPKNLNEIMDAYYSPEAHQVLKENVSVLHCTTEYPAPFEQTHLQSMNSIKDIFDVKVGFSDHTKGISIPIAAVALGAEIIEKHFTTDKNLPGPDHKASLDPDELKVMVQSIREVESALGKKNKTPNAAELGNRKVARKSLVANCSIEKGTVFSSENLTSKRPGTGLSPMNYWDLIGKEANRNFTEDELISND